MAVQLADPSCLLIGNGRIAWGTVSRDGRATEERIYLIVNGVLGVNQPLLEVRQVHARDGCTGDSVFINRYSHPHLWTEEIQRQVKTIEDLINDRKSLSAVFRHLAGLENH